MSKKKPSDAQSASTGEQPAEAIESSADATKNSASGDSKPSSSEGAAAPAGASKAVAEPVKADSSKTEPVKSEPVKSEQVKPASPRDEDETSEPGFRIPLLGIFNLLLIIGLAATAYYYWLEQQKTEASKQQVIASLQKQLTRKAEASDLRGLLAPLESSIGNSSQSIEQLKQQQRDLESATEKLYELFGRDESSWQVTEVEYLLRVAQHKLILQNDFEGAAVTLQAASDKLASLSDPGMLPVRARISDEIAALKTRSRPDLVGMTLLLSQLNKQLRALKPGFAPRVEATPASEVTPEAVATPAPVEQRIDKRIIAFLKSLVSVKRTDSSASSAAASTGMPIDLEDSLEDNLKLTRWAVLERDDYQYQRLMRDNVELFKQYYDLDNAANHDFYTQLQQLQKATLKPELPDIGGSLELLKKIISRRQLGPEGTSSEGDGNV